MLLSQYCVLADYAEGPTPGSNRNFQSQTASLAASKAATYSASMVESAMQDYFTLLQVMAPPPKVNTNFKVDFLASLFDWKFETVYPLCTRLSDRYTNT